ncbi:unnamed protein product [Sphagnum troendelagicum]|uniref:Uncharacterized protein n=1 Tax=Sphagnum jensenii TaxID=128206 RepID=A0ABP1BWA7_9BRYO
MILDQNSALLLQSVVFSGRCKQKVAQLNGRDAWTEWTCGGSLMQLLLLELMKPVGMIWKMVIALVNMYVVFIYSSTTLYQTCSAQRSQKTGTSMVSLPSIYMYNDHFLALQNFQLLSFQYTGMYE